MQSHGLKRRPEIEGRGMCIGAIAHLHGPVIHGDEDKYKELGEFVGKSLRDAFGIHDFYRSSIQVNGYTVASRHTDDNNRGLSTIVILGGFRGGGLCICLIFDGHQYHYSHPFTGVLVTRL